MLKISEMLTAILLAYPTSGFTYGKNVCCCLKMTAIFKILKYYIQLQFDIDMKKSGQIIP